MKLLIFLIALVLHGLLHRYSWNYRTRVCRRAVAWWRYWTRDTPEQRLDREFQDKKRTGQIVLAVIGSFFLGAAALATLISAM